MKRIASLALVSLFVAACGTQTTHEQSALQAATANKLAAGDYVVTVSRLETCTVGELALEKSYEYDARMKLANVQVEAVGYVPDNLMRAAVCMPGTSVGKIKVSLPTAATLTAVTQSKALKIEKVERIEKTQAVVRATGESVTVKAGQYLVAVEGFDGCNGNSEINVAKAYELSFDAETLDRTDLTNAGIVRDNLVRTAVCRSGALKGEALVTVEKTTELRAGEGLTIKAVRKITKLGAAR